jgi:endogenous inhibitor of DNA gyrase (YacG/DUF329 family)
MCLILNFVFYFPAANLAWETIERVRMKPVRPVKCPTCQKQGNWFDGKYGPFCSHRCKLVDLGKWFTQENRISEPLRPEHLDPFADLPPSHELDRPEKGEE